jgi:hypothetical protein
MTEPDYIEQFLDILKTEDAERMAQIVQEVEKKVLAYLDERILKEKEDLSKLEATADRLRTK